MSLLEIKHLHTYFKTKKGIVKAVNDVSYSVEAGRTMGVVGESGSGKSVSAMSILQLLDSNGYIESGEILFEGKDLTKLSIEELYKIRGNAISVIFQEPMTSLNPVFTVERQLSEPLMIHQHMKKKEARQHAIEMLRDEFAVFGIDDGLNRRTEHLHVVFLQYTTLVELNSAIQCRLSAEAEQDAIGTFLLDDLLDEKWSDRQEIHTVGNTFRSLHSGDIRVDENALDAFFLQCLESL